MPPGVGVGGFGIALTNVFPVQGFAVVWVSGSAALGLFKDSWLYAEDDS